jgi:hypothetical protein
MRKLLLITLAVGVTSLSIAQNANSYVKVAKNQATKTFIDQEIFNSNAPINKTKTQQKGAVTSVPVSSSANVYSFLVEKQTVITANQDVNLINISHRGRAGVIGVSSGDIISCLSTNSGDSWKSIVAIPAIAGALHRYPGAVIYNPTANTNPNNAYIVAVGPTTDGSNWVSTFTASHKVDSTNFNSLLLPSYGSLARNGLQSTSDGKFHVITSNYNSTTTTLDTIRLITGTWDAVNNKVDWVENLMDANFVVNSLGEEGALIWDFNTAFSNDGTIGYMWTLGRDSSNDTRSYQPIVWKTTNSGATWTKMPVYDFSNLSTITNELRYMGGLTQKRPQFSSSNEGVVDANGNLHLITQIGSAFSNNDDSLGYSFMQTFEGMPGHNTIFDVYTTSTGWAAHRLGYVYTIDVDADNTPYGTQGWDLRVQAGKSADETKVFATWTDSDTSFAMTSTTGFPMNSFPDLFAVGIDITNGNRTETTNFTEGTSITGDIYFHYMSDVVLENSGVYSIPVTELDLGATDLDPVDFNYLKGITFENSDFVPNPGFGHKTSNIASVSQNRPNPFSGSTNIQVNLSESANLSIEVISITGQKVFEVNYGKSSAGIHNLTIDASQMASGVYFYTVRAGETSITNKMIVK